MSNNTNPRFLTMLGALLLLALVVGFACGGGSDSGEETPQPGSDGDATPTVDAVANQTREAIRELESPVLILTALFQILERGVGPEGSFSLGTPEQPAGDWFECCRTASADIERELQDITRELPGLLEIYQEAGDQESLALVERIGAAAANSVASLSVLASLPTRTLAAAVVEDISSQFVALADAVADLR